MCHSTKECTDIYDNYVRPKLPVRVLNIKDVSMMYPIKRRCVSTTVFLLLLLLLLLLLFCFVSLFLFCFVLFCFFFVYLMTSDSPKNGELKLTQTVNQAEDIIDISYLKKNITRCCVS